MYLCSLPFQQQFPTSCKIIIIIVIISIGSKEIKRVFSVRRYDIQPSMQKKENCSRVVVNVCLDATNL